MSSSVASEAPITRGARYRVFLSYSHSDTKWARWLMQRLESYSVPKRLRGRAAPIGEVGRRIAPVFRDRDELPTTNDLGETIRGALRDSATLVVICSPAAARSRWVQEEITAFKRLHGESGVFAFIVEGEPKVAGATDDCFPPALRCGIGADGEASGAPAEVVAADARECGDGSKLAFVRLVAGLLGVGYDDLRQRELQRRNRRLMMVTACSMAGMALTLGSAIIAWQARDDARRRQVQAEDVLAFMLGDFRGELKKLGQLKLLEPVGEKAMAYFDSLDPRDLTDTSLKGKARALTQIGEVRMEEAKYDQALRAFTTAQESAAKLAARHPENGDMLFERAQAEFWIAAVNRNRGDLAAARDWISRYRETARALVVLERNSPRARRELVSGHHNLAVLEFDRGNYAAARPAFLAEKASVEELLAASPGDPGLKLKLADIASWLGLIAERSGEFAEAIERLAESAERVRELVAQEPGVARWRVKLADTIPLAAHVQARAGRRAEAAAGYVQARALIDGLVAQDPKNRQWRMRAASVQLSHAELLIGERNYAAAAESVRVARGEIEQLVAAEPSDSTFARLLAKAWRSEAAVRLADGRADAAEAAERAIALGESVHRARNDDWILWELAQSHLLAGRGCADAGERGAAEMHWNRVLALVEPRFPTDDWRMLDSAAQAHALLGHAERARPLSERLRRFGYQPVNPFAATTLAALSPTVPSATNK